MKIFTLNQLTDKVTKHFAKMSEKYNTTTTATPEKVANDLLTMFGGEWSKNYVEYCYFE